jgi:hypothetical protein
MKRILFFIFICLGSFELFGAAPELKNVLPNSWEKLSRLAQNEIDLFLLENTDNLARIKTSIRLRYSHGSADYTVRYIYRQTFSNAVFYRLIFTKEEHTDFSGFKSQFFQAIIMQQNNVFKPLYVLGYGFLEFGLTWSMNTIYQYTSLDIIEKNGRALGLLITSASITVDENINYIIDSKINGNECKCYYVPFAFLPENLLEMAMNDSYPYVLFGGLFLVDANIPLRYSLQNAFDNNVSTSYVSIPYSPSHSLMAIEFSAKNGLDISISYFGLINGYAQTSSLYYANNRLKRLGFTMGHDEEGNFKDFDFELQDNTLNEQKVYLDIQLSKHSYSFHFYAVEIYSGEKYNDTCIAEINLYDWNFTYSDSGSRN